jgi:hypothetical protein
LFPYRTAFIDGDLPDDPIWTQLEEIRSAQQADLEARLALYRAVRASVANFPFTIVHDLESRPAETVNKSAVATVSEHYVFALHRAGFANALNRADWLRSKEDFRDGRAEWMPLPPPGDPVTVSLDGPPLIVGSRALAGRAIDYFLQIQSEMHAWDELRTAASAFEEAQRATDLIRSSLDRIRRSTDVPGRCRECPGAIGA